MGDRRAALRFLCLFGAVWLPLFALSLRVQPPEFRPWERLAVPDALRFVPNQKLEMIEIGDLAAWSWVRELQTERQAVFSTDRHGLRNPDMDSQPQVVVVGDSFVGGSGLVDSETLTARMSEKLGEPVYNYAFSSAHMPALFINDPRFAAHPPQVVVYAPNQRNLKPSLGLLPAPRPPKSVDAELQAAMVRLESSSSLTRLARYTLNGLQYEPDGRGDTGLLPDGTAVLRLPLDYQRLSVPLQARGLDQVWMAIAALNQLLSQRGTRLVFAPIPDVGNVYPELYPEAERATIATPSMIDFLVAAARAAGIPVVDLPQLFRASKWPYLYRRDDSHWNERAVELTAEALAASVRPLLSTPPPAPVVAGAAPKP